MDGTLEGYSCKVDSMEEEPILDALFGIYDVQNFSGKDD